MRISGRSVDGRVPNSATDGADCVSPRALSAVAASPHGCPRHSDWRGFEKRPSRACGGTEYAITVAKPESADSVRRKPREYG